MKDQLILINSYLHGIWGYRWSALLVAWIVALLGWATVYSLPDRYTSQTTIHINTKSIIKPLLKGLAVESKVKSGLAIMTPLLLSRKNLVEVIRETDMDLDASSPEAMDRIVEKFSRSITLTQRKKANIYELSYEGSSADLSYRVVSKLLNTLIENTLSSARTDTAEAQIFIDRQITEYEKRLTTAEQRLAEFKRANLGLMPDKRGGYYNRLQRKLSEIEGIRSELQLAERRLLELKKQLQGEVPLLDNNSYRPRKILKLRKYREQLETLLARYTEQHPDVQALRVIIADALADESVDEDAFVNLGTGDSVEFNPVYQDLKADLHRAGVEVETLKLELMVKEKSVDRLKQSVDVIPGVEAKLAKLNRGYEITRERYLSLVERRESARLAQEVGQSGNNISFQIIEPPRVPTKPSGPNRFLFLTAVLLAAIVAGLGWGLFRHRMQPTFISLNQVRDRVDLPVLGSVGLFMTAEHKKRRQIQLTSFILVFSLLIVSYGGVMVFRGTDSDLVNTLISLRSSEI